VTEIERLTIEIGRWSDHQFGSSDQDGDRAGILTLLRLKMELEELLGTPNALEEWADVLMLYLDAARRRGITVQEVLSATWDKLEVNRKRKWGKPDADGVVEHIKEREPAITLTRPECPFNYCDQPAPHRSCFPYCRHYNQADPEAALAATKGEEK
jgi:hypothetical protein